MRFTIHLCLALALLFSGCAYQGTVVKKQFRLLPFSESLGIEAIYKFELRDRAGQIHSQMVTPEVFASYQVGDYFNDLQMPSPMAEPPAPGPMWRPVPRHGPTEYHQLPYQPVRTTAAPLRQKNQVASRSKRIAKRSSTPHSANRHHRKRTAKMAKHKKSHAKLARARRSRKRAST